MSVTSIGSCLGIAAYGTDHAGSDVDLLVRFDDDASLYDLVELREKLEKLLGVGVDVVSEGGLRPADRHVLTEAISL